MTIIWLILKYVKGYGPSHQLIQDEKQICVNVSTFLPLVWNQRPGEECRTELIQKCEERKENVCGDVTETICEVIQSYFHRLGMSLICICRARLEFVEFYTGDGPGFSFKWFALNCKSKYDSWKNGAKQSWLY